jgi:nitrogen fixation protein NifU and related proteins
VGQLFAGIGILLSICLLWFLGHYFLAPHLDRVDGQGRITGTCGDTMEIKLKFKTDTVRRSSYWTDGCIYSLNCIYQAAELAKGKTPAEILDMGTDDICRAVGGLPADHLHCASLAVDTLHAGVDHYMQKMAASQV